MPGVIDLWDMLIVYLFELHSTEKSKRDPSKKKNLKKLEFIEKFLLSNKRECAYTHVIVPSILN